MHLQASLSFKTQSYLQKKFPLKGTAQNIFINGSICPNQALLDEIKCLSNGEVLSRNGTMIAVCLSDVESFGNHAAYKNIIESHAEGYIHVKNNFDIFSRNGQAIEEDFERVTAGRKSQPLSASNRVMGAGKIFIEEGAKVEFAILNASTGPIYIGKDAEVMEGSNVRGPFALCEHAGLKMDAKIYGPTTIGPHSKVGGEVNNSVIFGYSNKAHDGFLGNAVIGEWCNLGADTNNSNLKNTYEEVKLWNYTLGKFEKTGLTFCGLMMGDHAKCGINTMFNTGTVVGVGANVFGAGFPRNFIPDFSWGGAQGFETFMLNKFFNTASAVYNRRNLDLSETDRDILKEVFEETRKYRFWEK